MRVCAPSCRSRLSRFDARHWPGRTWRDDGLPQPSVRAGAPAGGAIGFVGNATSATGITSARTAASAPCPTPIIGYAARPAAAEMFHEAYRRDLTLVDYFGPRNDGSRWNLPRLFRTGRASAVHQARHAGSRYMEGWNLIAYSVLDRKRRISAGYRSSELRHLIGPGVSAARFGEGGKSSTSGFGACGSSLLRFRTGQDAGLWRLQTRPVDAIGQGQLPPDELARDLYHRRLSSITRPAPVKIGREFLLEIRAAANRTVSNRFQLFPAIPGRFRVSSGTTNPERTSATILVRRAASR